MKYYLYESHLGSIYIEKRELSIDEVYCEECGDCDIFIGEFETKDELLELLNDEDLYYTQDYINAVINEFEE